jgi:hypothetical protein
VESERAKEMVGILEIKNLLVRKRLYIDNVNWALKQTKEGFI